MMDAETNRREQAGLAREIVATIEGTPVRGWGVRPRGRHSAQLAERLAELGIALEEWRASGEFASSPGTWGGLRRPG
jgi:hypothetical protein